VKRLYLLRHAKSSWKDPSLADHDRPLAGRGRRAAKQIAEHLRRSGIQPELVICSSSRRTRETLERIRSVLGDETVRIEREVYAAGEQGLLERLRRLPDEVDSVMLIGHNPGLQNLAFSLARSEDAAVDRLAQKFPTGALATFEIEEESWRSLQPGTAKLVDYVTPRELG
jgi:phosphohistidine phosphatase